MKTEKLYEIGEQVLIPMKVVKRDFDNRGAVKYKLKDQKSGKIFDWFYTEKDIIEDKTKKGQNENK